MSDELILNRARDHKAVKAAMTDAWSDYLKDRVSWKLWVVAVEEFLDLLKVQGYTIARRQDWPYSNKPSTDQKRKSR